jgi:hypothetical protein
VPFLKHTLGRKFGALSAAVAVFIYDESKFLSERKITAHSGTARELIARFVLHYCAPSRKLSVVTQSAHKGSVDLTARVWCSTNLVGEEIVACRNLEKSPERDVAAARQKLTAN